MSAGGKGHARRPTDAAAYSAGYDAIFGRKDAQAFVDETMREFAAASWDRQTERLKAGRKADQALADSMRAENLAQATEQHAKDGNDAG